MNFTKMVEKAIISLVAVAALSVGIRGSYVTLRNPELTQTQALLTTLCIKDYRSK